MGKDGEMGKHMQDDKMNSLLKRVSGKGRMHYKFLEEEYKSAGGTAFGKTIDWYAQRWPDRVVIHRPYNISASPMIEVLPNG